jgi:hypothetical protein
MHLRIPYIAGVLLAGLLDVAAGVKLLDMD